MKRLSIITTIILGAAVFCGCSQDDLLGPATPQDGRLPIPLRFVDAEKVETYSVASENERMISDAYVVVFDGSTGKYKDMEKVEAGVYITGNGTQTPTINTIAEILDGDKVVVLINSNYPRNPRFNDTHTVSDINTIIPSAQWSFSQSGADSGKGMPMSGEVTWSNATPPVCQVSRAVAKIQVALAGDLTSKDVTGKFTTATDAVQWAICNAPKKGDIYSVNGAMSVPEVTDADFFNENAAGEYPHRVTTMTGVSAFQSNGYLPEYNSSVKAKTATIGDSEFAADRTCVVLKVAGTGVSGGPGYYRLDLVEGNKAGETKKYMDIRRNYHYTIHITRVSSKGYDTPEEALAAPGSNVEYEITDNASNIIGNGQYAIVVDKDRIEVFSDITTAQNLMIVGLRGEFPAGALCKVSLVHGKTSTAVTVNEIQLLDADGTAVTGNRFEQNITGDYQFKYRSRALTSTDMHARISCGNIVHYIPIEIGSLTLELSAEEVEIGYQGGQTVPITIHTNYPGGWTAEVYGYENVIASVTPPHGISGETLSATVNLWENAAGEFRASRVRISTANGAVSKLLTVKQTVFPDVQIKGALEMAPIPVGVFPADYGDYALRLNLETIDNLYMIVYTRNANYAEVYWTKMAGWNAETEVWDLLDQQWGVSMVAYDFDGYAYYGMEARWSSWRTHYSNGNWVMIRYYLSKDEWTLDRNNNSSYESTMHGKGFQSSLVNTLYDTGYVFPYPPRL